MKGLEMSQGSSPGDWFQRYVVDWSTDPDHEVAEKALDTVPGAFVFVKLIPGGVSKTFPRNSSLVTHFRFGAQYSGKAIQMLKRQGHKYLVVLTSDKETIRILKPHAMAIHVFTGCSLGCHPSVSDGTYTFVILK